MTQSALQLGHGLEDRGLVVRFLGGARIFYFPHNFQTDCGSTQPHIEGSNFPSVQIKRPGVKRTTGPQPIRRLSGAVPPFSYTPSRREQEQIYIYFTLCHKAVCRLVLLLLWSL